jgi:serpin B
VKTAVDAAPTMSAVMSEFVREMNPTVASTDLDALVDGNSTFAWNLYKQVIKEEKGNVFFSPYSISSAFAMVSAGAKGKTATEMANTMSFVLPQSSLHKAFNGLDQELALRCKNGLDSNGDPLKLNIANALWGERSETFIPDFLKLLAVNYGAGTHQMNFMGAPEESRKEINDWVAEQTNQKIKDLLTPGAINDYTRLVLTNAIYFNAAWSQKFDPDSTKDDDFKLIDGKVIKVPLMRRAPRMGGTLDGLFVSNDTYQIAAIPYSGNELSLLVILPNEGKFYEVEKALDVPKIKEMITGLYSTLLMVELPKLELDKELNLKKILREMGMSYAFDSSRADFTGMSNSSGLCIDGAIHKAYVKMNEEGTEAAAATGISVAGGLGGPSIVDFIVNRPYIFLISDDVTGSILFLGRVMNPLE